MLRLTSTGRLCGRGEEKSRFGCLCGAFSAKTDKMMLLFKKKLKIVLMLNFKLRSEDNDSTIQYKMSRFHFSQTKTDPTKNIKAQNG